MRIQAMTGSRPSARRGAAATEFALLLPLLGLLLFAAIDFGRFAHSYIGVTNAARAGAGYGCVNPFTTSTEANWKGRVRQAVIDELSQMSGFNQNQLSVTVSSPSSGEPTGMWRVQVDVSYPFQTVVNWPGIPHNLTLRRTVVLRGIR